MKVGVGTIVYEFAGIPLIDSIERIASHGIEYIDLLAFGDFNPAFLSINQQKKILDRMKKLKVNVSSVVTCAHGNLASNDEAERDFAIDQLKRAAVLVRNLGGRQILIGKGAGNIDFDLTREQAWDNVVSLLIDFCAWCNDLDVLVTLELEPEALHLCNSVASMKQFIDDINAPNMVVNIDLGHLNILRTSPEELSILKDRIVHVHISDNDGLVHTNSIIGEGNTDIGWYIKKLLDWGIDEVAKSYGEVAVAGIELGHPGEYIANPDYRVLKSIGNVYSCVPHFRNRSFK